MKLIARRTPRTHLPTWRVFQIGENIESKILDLRWTAAHWDIRPLHEDSESLWKWAARARQLPLDATLHEALAKVRGWLEYDDEEDRSLYEAETYAENAWLRAAEAPTNDDLGFEEYERNLGKVDPWFDASPAAQHFECNEGRYL